MTMDRYGVSFWGDEDALQVVMAMVACFVGALATPARTLCKQAWWGVTVSIKLLERVGAQSLGTLWGPLFSAALGLGSGCLGLFWCVSDRRGGDRHLGSPLACLGHAGSAANSDSFDPQLVPSFPLAESPHREEAQSRGFS